MFWDWNWGGEDSGSFLWVMFVLAVLVTPWVFFLMTLRGLLEKVSPPNRAMPPEHVWLNFIPVFNLGWFIYTVAKVRDSVRAEYDSRGWPLEGDFGYNVGLAAGIVGICSVVLGWVPVIDFGVGVAALICWILYWLKIADLRNRLSFGDQWHGTVSPPPYADYQWPYDRPTRSGCRHPSALCSVLSAWPRSRGRRRRPQTGAAAGRRSAARGRSGRRRSGHGRAAGFGCRRSAPRPTQCAVCDTTVAPDDKFCRGCGLPLPVTQATGSWGTRLGPRLCGICSRSCSTWSSSGCPECCSF